MDLTDSLETSQVEVVIRTDKEILEPGDYSFPTFLHCFFSLKNEAEYGSSKRNS
jgi:hypothetical protein